MNKIIKTELIENYIKENNLTKSKLCKLCDISTKKLNLLLKNKVKIKIETLVKISKLTKISIDDFLGLKFPIPKKKA